MSSSPKYKKYFEQMFEENKELFMNFMILNQDYGRNKKRLKYEFDEHGSKIKGIVNQWENRLCGAMEKGQNSAFSSKLGEKFIDEVTRYFPYWHEIGLK